MKRARRRKQNREKKGGEKVLNWTRKGIRKQGREEEKRAMTHILSACLREENRT